MLNRIAKAALDRALDEQETLLLVYQPIHDARSGAIRAVEALLRQRRETGEIREASIIAETAEESGRSALLALDHAVIRNACSDAARWPAGIRLNINLSAREFEDGDAVARLTSLVPDPRRVNLEITETAGFAHPRKALDVLRALKSLGFGIWLDDFGTGHSTLDHVLRFPLDVLKIAGVFVKALPDDARCAAIVRHTIALAHELGLAVVAEEVEHQEQLAFLRALDCELIQGFLFSRPMTAETLQATLAGDSSGQ